MPLSPREQKLLTAIEDELGEQDPALAAMLAPAPPDRADRLPVGPRQAAALGVALVVLVVAHAVGLAPGLLGTGLLTVVLLVPWTVWTARSTRSPTPAAPPARSSRTSTGRKTP